MDQRNSPYIRDPTSRRFAMDDKPTYGNPQHIPCNPHQLATDERMAAVRPDAQVEPDLLRRVLELIADAQDPTVEVDHLRLVLEEESDVRDEERLFHKLLIEHRAAYGIDRLFGTVK